MLPTEYSCLFCPEDAQGIVSDQFRRTVITMLPFSWNVRPFKYGILALESSLPGLFLSFCGC